MKRFILPIFAAMDLVACATSSTHTQREPNASAHAEGVTWQRTKWHWAFKGETIVRAKEVILECKAVAQTAVTPPEAIIPPAYEMWGLKFGGAATDEQRACVLRQLRVTKGEYYSPAEAQPE